MLNIIQILGGLISENQSALTYTQRFHGMRKTFWRRKCCQRGAGAGFYGFLELFLYISSQPNIYDILLVLESGHDRSINTIEIGKHYKSGLFVCFS